MPSGGPGRGQGRKHGSKSQRTLAREAALKKAADTLGADFAGDAHALLTVVYKDTGAPIDLRVDAAKAAIRYEKPALANVTATHDATGGLADLLKAIDGRTRGLPPRG